MTGPEHFRAAERIIADAEGRDLRSDAAMAFAAVAQVHATLALAAATAAALGDSYQWREVTS